ncbi:homoserine kinase [Loigolactobacillus jiayinensis]|uniref:Homoserine kinase n=1 Tax=Loigolactobacillus jiayinensis TaxID=2486016 RepID=A0ABW1RBQ5_9LACO|nr:homoserine kinase [Loigolactobacillus jiayinensis]
MTTIRVPATSANLGPGFDSIGIALELYLTLTIAEPRATWFIEHEMGVDVPSDEHNLIIKTALALIPDLTPHHLIMKSAIPLARGLGSSSSAIIAGIELANQLGKLDLTQYDELQIAVRLEGHPDNVAPAIYGGFVTATYDEVEADAISAPFPAARALTYIPDTELLTSASRAILPEKIPLRAAVTTSSSANVLVAAVLRGDLETAGRMMERDQFHEVYREKLVPHLEQIREKARAVGACGTYLSGAGPTVISMVPVDEADEILGELQQLPLTGQWLNLAIAPAGLLIEA